jgi:hypothetical protein
MAVLITELGIVIRPQEVGLTYPGVLPIHQCTFPYGHHSVSYRVGHTIRCLVSERVLSTGFEPVTSMI